jgi:hypothetical protein
MIKVVEASLAEPVVPITAVTIWCIAGTSAAS